MKKGFGLAGSVILLLTTAAAWAYPEPAVVQDVKQWTLTVEYSQPEQLMLRMGSGNTVQRFWYIILTVTNHSDFEEVSFYPACELMTDTFKLIPADRTVPKTVFEVVRQRNQGRYPFLESLDFIDHRIFKGEDNARDFAIIWPDFDPRAKEISLFIEGLSNETAVLPLPETQESEAEKTEPVVLQKTLHLKYAIGGDEKLRQTAVLKEISSDWVMR
jgi:hypothetical protein